MDRSIMAITANPSPSIFTKVIFSPNNKIAKSTVTPKLRLLKVEAMPTFPDFIAMTYVTNPTAATNPAAEATPAPFKLISFLVNNQAMKVKTVKDKDEKKVKDTASIFGAVLYNMAVIP